MEILNGPDDACLILRFCDSYALKRRQLVKEDVWIKQGIIVDPQKLFYQHCSSNSNSIHNINCSGCIISPGFIDLQINGILTYLLNSFITKFF